jgi:hypothetical protein
MCSFLSRKWTLSGLVSLAVVGLGETSYCTAAAIGYNGKDEFRRIRSQPCDYDGNPRQNKK